MCESLKISDNQVKKVTLHPTNSEFMRVLMVCLGNICRSPMADGWLRHKVKTYNLPIEVDSAGTANYHVGSKPDHRMIRFSKEYGVSINELRARQFTVADFDNYDIIFAMDKSNEKNILRLARNEEDKQKVRLFLNELHPDKDLEVPDPYYGTDQNFKEVIELLDQATNAFLKNNQLIAN